MFSDRYQKSVVLTDHARSRMGARDISEVLLLDLLETGEVRNKDETHLWIAKHYPGRADNRLCAVVVLESAIVVKTVMHHFSWESGS